MKKNLDVTKEIKKIMKENPTVSVNQIAEILNVKAEAFFHILWRSEIDLHFHISQTTTP